jgi:hypothetical protein
MCTTGENANSDLSVLVLSCDKYKDLWLVFAHYFQAHWGNCPYPVYLLTNEESFQHDRIVSLQTGKDTGWSDSLISALNQIETQYVLFLQEDAFFNLDIDNGLVVNGLHFLGKLGGTTVKLRPARFPGAPLPDAPSFARISSHTPYRNGLFLSIWNRSRLLTYLRPGESAWDFETRAGDRTESDTGFYSARHGNFKFIHGVIKGRWVRSAYHQVLIEIPGYTTSRPIMSAREESLLNAYIAARGLFIKIFGVRIFKAIHKVRWSV